MILFEDIDCMRTGHRSDVLLEPGADGKVERAILIS